MKIQIWSDIQCPFCYIGKRQLESALDQFPNRGEIEIEWKSYQLDPSLPERSLKDTDAYHYIANSKGISLEQSTKMHNDVTSWAQRVGLSYRFDKAVIVNSMKAHRIIQLAKQHNLGDVAEERFFKAYFTEGKDLSNPETLLSLGLEIGLTATDVEEALNDAKYAQLVQQDIQQAAQLGIRGVPFFLIDGKYAISGAQPTTVFLQGLQQAYHAWKQEQATIEKPGEGASCSPDGKCE